jgi:hypothetical protein
VGTCDLSRRLLTQFPGDGTETTRIPVHEDRGRVVMDGATGNDGTVRAGLAVRKLLGTSGCIVIRAVGPYSN